MAMQDNLRLRIEDAGLDLTEEQIEAITEAMETKDKASTNDQNRGDIAQREFVLKNELANESDWRKKAALAARIISLNLE